MLNTKTLYLGLYLKKYINGDNYGELLVENTSDYLYRRSKSYYRINSDVEYLL